MIVVAEKNKFNKTKLSGTIQNDILKEYIARGTYIYPPKNSLRIVTDIFEYCNINIPKWNTISISGYHIREAGSTAIQELGFTFSNAIEYVNAAIEKGLKVDEFGKRISFFFNCHMDFFEEIAKFRAARVIWAKIMKNRFNAKDPKAMMCRFHTQTAGSSLTAQQIENNLVRTCIEATAAVLGGTQSLHTNSMDEALALPSEKTAEIALRTQQVIAYETGIPEVTDPLAGSYYIESLTNEIINKTEKLITKVDDLGGAIKGIEMEFQQNEISQSAYEYQQKIDNHEKVIVGVNKYKVKEDITPQLQEIDEKETSRQVNRVKKYKKNRDQIKLKKSLDKLKKVAKSNDNIFKYIIDAIKANATLGEISDTLRQEFGEYA